MKRKGRNNMLMDSRPALGLLIFLLYILNLNGFNLAIDFYKDFKNSANIYDKMLMTGMVIVLSGLFITNCYLIYYFIFNF